MAPFSALLQAELLVIGAGIAGLSTLLEAAERGIKTLCVEARRPGVRLMALTVDEGVAGYRDHGLRVAEEVARKLDLSIVEIRILAYNATLKFISELINESSSWEANRGAGLSIRIDETEKEILGDIQEIRSELKKE